MYYVASIFGKVVEQEVTGVLGCTKDIVYQGTSLSEALMVRNRFGEDYEVYKLDETGHYFVPAK